MMQPGEAGAFANLGLVQMLVPSPIAALSLTSAVSWMRTVMMAPHPAARRAARMAFAVQRVTPRDEVDRRRSSSASPVTTDSSRRSA